MNKDQTPSVAILLAAYNGMHWIEEQIDSIFSQADVVVDLYISVDLSNDGTDKWCQSLSQKDSRVHMLPYGEHFGGAAKNFFRLIKEVDFSNYDFVALADQDDVWLPNKLSHAIEKIQQQALQAFSSDVTAFFLDSGERLIKKSQPQKQMDYFFEAAGPGCTYVFKSDALQKFKDFLTLNWHAVNKIELHDWMIYAYFRSNQLAWHIDTKPLMRYRIHASNQMGINSGFKAYQKRFSMIRSGWYKSQVEGIQSLLEPTLSLNRLFLIKNFYQLRRQFQDALILLIFLIFGIY